MTNTSARVLDEAQVLPVWEFMEDATPEKVEYVMACYIDSLIQSGVPSRSAEMEARRVTSDAISSAISDLSGGSRARGGSIELPFDAEGSVQYNFEYCYSEGDGWHTVMFEDIDDARDFATDVLARNESNPKFFGYARRIVQVITCDFYDYSIPPTRMKVIQEHEDF